MAMSFFRKVSSGQRNLPAVRRAPGETDSEYVQHDADDSEHDDERGPLGLNLLSHVTDPVVDIVFVHGLGGGSRKSWSYSGHKKHFWPQEWLPKEVGFTNARVHSFGYNASWVSREDSVLNVHDFAQSLLSAIQDGPGIGRDNTRIIFVGHSMGGIVIKNVCVLARQDPAFESLAARFHTVYFLATPHRGSDLAKTLGNILHTANMKKPFVSELNRGAASTAAVNDSFRHCAQYLQLFSFYETKPMKKRLFSAMIVDKDSAILGYGHERVALLEADHRSICKFDRRSDPNYKVLRNSLASTINKISDEVALQRNQSSQIAMQQTMSIFRLLESSEDDLSALTDQSIAGTCEWVTMTTNYLEWRDSNSGNAEIFWLHGGPGTGKSVLSAHVVHNLKLQGLACGYFFFKDSSAGKATVNDCLLSLAYQMALQSPSIRFNLLQLEADVLASESANENWIWRKVFQTCIFRTEHNRLQFWVIDGLDECRKPNALLSFIDSLPGWIRVFTTSQKSYELEQGFSKLQSRLRQQKLRLTDTLPDITLFVESRITQIPTSKSSDIKTMAKRIIEMSNGSFLWVRLVMEELEHVWSLEAAGEVLNNLSANMSSQYGRSLERLSRSSGEQKLAKAIFKWTVCSARSLTLAEMRSVLTLDTEETVPNLDQMIRALCGQLIVVDHNGKLQLFHQTAKKFLLREDLVSEFAVREEPSHTRMAVVCLKHLCFDCFPSNAASQSQPFTDKGLGEYASFYFSHHVSQSSVTEPAIVDLICVFLKQSVLFWVEYIARTGDLGPVNRTVADIRAYMDRCSRCSPSTSSPSDLIDSWMNDLARVTLKFRLHLLASPSSIRMLVPPLCPSGTAIAQNRASWCSRALVVKGPIAVAWDDCVAEIDFQGANATAINYGENLVAVGLSTGAVLLYSTISLRNQLLFEHKEKVKLLRFGLGDKLLASSGFRTIRIWRVDTEMQQCCFAITHQPLTLMFANFNEVLMVVTQGDCMLTLSISENREVASTSLEDRPVDVYGNDQWRPPPHGASFSPDGKLLAMSYRRCHAVVFDISQNNIYGHYSRYAGTGIAPPSIEYTIDAMTFNQKFETQLLIVSYGDGELAIFDLWSTELLYRNTEVYAHCLDCSPDGRTLITGSGSGHIKLFSFNGKNNELLVPLCSINAPGGNIKSISISEDSLRFVDLRPEQCCVWEPAALIRRGSGISSDGNVTDTTFAASRHFKTLTETTITSIACHSDGETIFCGKSNGQIYIYNSSNAQQYQILSGSGPGKHDSVSHLILANDKRTLISAAASSRIMVYTIERTRSNWSVSGTLTDKRFGQIICGILVNDQSDRLLLTGRDCSDLWTAKGDLVRRFTAADGQLWPKVISHPTRQDCFLVLTSSATHTYKWADSAEVDCSCDARHVRPLIKHTEHPWSSDLFSHSSGTILELSTTSRTASPKLEIWTMSDGDEHVKPLGSEFDLLAPRVYRIITINQDLLIFVDLNLWICSLDIGTFQENPRYQRHFFLPSDWLNSFRNITMKLTTKKEVVYAKEDELFVFKRAFDFSETVLLSPRETATSMSSCVRAA